MGDDGDRAGAVAPVRAGPAAAYAYQDTPCRSASTRRSRSRIPVALVTDRLAPQPYEVVLEVGTGLGYLATMLAELAVQV